MAGEARKGRGNKGIVCCREDSVQLVLIEMTLSIICFSDICWSGSVFFFPSLRIVLLVTFPIPLRIDTWQIYSARFIVLSNSFKWNGVNKLEIVLTATLNLLEFAQVVAFALKVSIKGTSKCMNLICVRE